jgi:hypothetical protein
MKINNKVKVKEDVKGMEGWEGIIVGKGEEGCVYDRMWEVEFEGGECEFIMECDLEKIKLTK